jgi:hypothetical protein
MRDKAREEEQQLPRFAEMFVVISDIKNNILETITSSGQTTR